MSTSGSDPSHSDDEIATGKNGNRMNFQKKRNAEHRKIRKAQKKLALASELQGPGDSSKGEGNAHSDNDGYNSTDGGAPAIAPIDLTIDNDSDGERDGKANGNSKSDAHGDDFDKFNFDTSNEYAQGVAAEAAAVASDDDSYSDDNNEGSDDDDNDTEYSASQSEPENTEEQDYDDDEDANEVPESEPENEPQYEPHFQNQHEKYLIQNIYKYMASNRYDLRIGNHPEDDEAICTQSAGWGEVTLGSFQNLLRQLMKLKQPWRMDAQSEFLDIGSGCGKLVYHTKLVAQVAKADGIEYVRHRHALGIDCFRTLCNRDNEALEFMSVADSKQLQYSCQLYWEDVTECVTLPQDYTHVYIYDFVFNSRTHAAIAELLNKSQKKVVLISYHGTKRWKDAKLDNFELLKTIGMKTTAKDTPDCPNKVKAFIYKINEHRGYREDTLLTAAEKLNIEKEENVEKDGTNLFDPNAVGSDLEQDEDTITGGTILFDPNAVGSDLEEDEDSITGGTSLFDPNAEWWRNAMLYEQTDSDTE